MKKTLITAALLLAAITAFAQQLEILVYTNQRSIGRIIETQEEIIAKQYMFPEKIYHSYVDTIAKTITVQLRGMRNNGTWVPRGQLLYYDLTTGRVRWSKNIAYPYNLQQFGSVILEGRIRLNIENGRNLWRAESGSIRFVDPVANVGVGYSMDYDGTPINPLKGIDLETGKTIWQREISWEYNWNSVFKINDSEWIIAAAGLHAINIHNGAGWSYHAVTGERRLRALPPARVTGVFSNLFAGTFMIRTSPNPTSPTLTWNIASNVYSDSTSYYFASKEKIARINRDNGEVIWVNQFPDGVPSKSFLFANNSRVFMLNYGYASMDFRPINYGTPFFAAYDKENGEQIFFSTINVTRNPILDFKVIENELLLLLFKDRIIKYSGAQIVEKTIDNNELGELIGFINSRVYIDAENSYLANLPLFDIYKSFILTNKGKVLIVDEELDIVGEINTDQFYLANRRIGDYLFVTKDNKTFILDADNKKVAEIDMELNPALIGDKLYGIGENYFNEIDVANLIEQLQSVQNRRQEDIAQF